MKIEVINPGKYLKEYVKCYWVLEKGNYFHKERLFPTGELQLIFHYGNPFCESNKNSEEIKQPEFLGCGQFTKYRDIISRSDAGLIGVVFHPYSITSFFKMPAWEFSHSVIDLESIAKEYKTLGCMVQDAASTAERILIIEKFLLKKMFISNKHHFNLVKESIRYISESRSKFQIKDLSGKFNLSERQFERIFNKYVGLSPRSFSGIARFNRALRLINSRSSLTDISLDAGFYDQPQFIKDFKEFTGHTPGEYRALIQTSKMSF